jgi:hypothetical protein
MGRSNTMTCTWHRADLSYRTDRSVQNVIVRSRNLSTLNRRLGLASRNSKLQGSTSLQDHIVGPIVLVERMFVVVRVGLDAAIAD